MKNAARHIANRLFSLCPKVFFLFLAHLIGAVEYTVIPTELIPSPDPPYIAVGENLTLTLRGGRNATLEQDDEYIWGSCYWPFWYNCLTGNCGHENGECNIAASWYYRARLDNGAWIYGYSNYIQFSSGFTASNSTATPGTHMAHAEAQSCFCLHRINNDGLEVCSGPITYSYGDSLSFRVVKVAEINGPSGFSTNRKCNEVPLEFLSLPLGEADSTVIFSAVPYPSGNWPDKCPYWVLMNSPNQPQTQESKKWEASVKTDVAFGGTLQANCGLSNVAMELNVVEVNLLAPLRIYNDEWDDFWWVEWLELDDGDDDAGTRVFALECQRNTFMTVQAQPNPLLPAEKLPDAWQFSGGEGENQFERTIDLTVPSIHPFTASCGVSEKETQVVAYKVDLQVDSNNDGATDADDDLVEQDLPGRLIMVNNGDADGDGITDNKDFYIEGEPLFTEVKLTVSNFPDLENSRIFLSYAAAVPPETEGESLPSGGGVRIWTKQSSETRNPLAVKSGGDFVAPLAWNGENNGDSYTPAELGMNVTSAMAGGVSVGSGEITLFMEGVNSIGANYISVHVISRQKNLWMEEPIRGNDSALITTFAISFSLLEAPFTGGNPLSGEHMNSRGLPLVLNDDFDGHQADPKNPAVIPDNEDGSVNTAADLEDMGWITIDRLPSHLPENGSAKLEVSGGSVRLFENNSPYSLFWDSDSEMTEEMAAAFYASLKSEARTFRLEGYGSPGEAKVKLNVGDTDIKPAAIIRLIKTTRWLVTHDPVFEAKAGASSNDLCQQRECMPANKATIIYYPPDKAAIKCDLYQQYFISSRFILTTVSDGNSHEFTLAAPPPGSEEFADIWLQGATSEPVKLPGTGIYEIRIFDDQTLLVKFPLKIGPLIELRIPTIELGSDGKASPVKFNPYRTDVDTKFDFHLFVAFQDDQHGYGLPIRYILNGQLAPPSTGILVVSDSSGGDVGNHQLALPDSCLLPTSFWSSFLPSGGYDLKWEGFTAGIEEDTSVIWKFPGEAKDTDSSFASPAKVAKEGTYKVTFTGAYLYDSTQIQTLNFETEVDYGLAE